MPRMNVMDAVVGVMEDEGVEVAFGVPGAAILPLYKSLSRSDQIKHYSVRHEEGGTHAADGYARVTGKVGVNIGTSGPAGTNMITGLYTCMADSIPMICITGQAPTTVLHKEAFQAVDIVEIAKPVTKWAVQVKEPAQLVWTFREAFRVAQEGRPGPVIIDLPLDVTKVPVEVDFDPRRGGPLRFEKPAPRPGAIRQTIEMILEAERPILMPGGGVIIAEAAQELVELAEYLQVPVTPTYMSKGVIPEDHPLYMGTRRYTDQPALCKCALPGERPRRWHRQPLGGAAYRRLGRVPRGPQVRTHRHRPAPAGEGLPSRSRCALRRQVGPAGDAGDRPRHHPRAGA